jgi:hypothetical protein
MSKKICEYNPYLLTVLKKWKCFNLNTYDSNHDNDDDDDDDDIMINSLIRLRYT